ncbi:MAG: altronate dehydratase family protein [Rhizobiaceae bacterium]|nr:altronate dehydratase family protein [Rhizobiaceae bacterium]
MTQASTLKLDAADNIAVALADIAASTPVADGSPTTEDIGRGHKIALRAIATGEPVIKFGQIIGCATKPIAAGSLIHSHNLAMEGLRRESAEIVTQPPAMPERRHFDGYQRAGGAVGTRNYIGIIASVNCSTTVCSMIASEANRLLLPRFPNVDGFVAIIHDQGCGINNAGEGFNLLRRTIGGFCRHANFGGVLLIGLGCEVNQISLYAAASHGATIKSFNIQDAGGSRSAVRLALEQLEEVAAKANQAVRTQVSVENMTVGLQCGGSDGFSGITANPALGRAVDRLVRAGGTALLSETPEIYGAEHLLTARASEPVARQLNELIAWWENYTANNNASLDNNPSPGNKRGGLTTILEKSLGAVAKGGSAPLSAVTGYAEPAKTNGLIFMDSPGYDPVSATGQVAAGANMIAFTTGRGSCFGCRPTPSIKISSSSDLYRQMEEDMDVNAGTIVDGTASIDEVGEEIYNTLLDVASGAQSKSELFGYGDNEFVPWRIGAVL